MLTLVLPVVADVVKALLPSLLQFLWNQSHEPTTVEEAASDDARRERLLAAVRTGRAGR